MIKNFKLFLLLTQCASLIAQPSIPLSTSSSFKRLQRQAPWGLARISSRENKPFDNLDAFSYFQGPDIVNVYIVDFEFNVNQNYFVHPIRIMNASELLHNESDYFSETSTPLNQGHAIAGIIASIPYGVARNVQIISAQINKSTQSAYNLQVIAQLVNIEKEIHKSNRKSIVYISFPVLSETQDDLLINHIAGMLNRNILVVFTSETATTDTCDLIPSVLKDALIAGMIDNNNKMTSNSMRGACVDIFAPGTNVATLNSDTTPNNVASGPHIATAHVVGVLALLMTRSEIQFSSMKQVKAYLYDIGSYFSLDTRAVTGQLSPRIIYTGGTASLSIFKSIVDTVSISQNATVMNESPQIQSNEMDMQVEKLDDMLARISKYPLKEEIIPNIEYYPTLERLKKLTKIDKSKKRAKERRVILRMERKLLNDVDEGLILTTKRVSKRKKEPAHFVNIDDIDKLDLGEETEIPDLKKSANSSTSLSKIQSMLKLSKIQRKANTIETLACIESMLELSNIERKANTSESLPVIKSMLEKTKLQASISTKQDTLIAPHILKFSLANYYRKPDRKSDKSKMPIESEPPLKSEQTVLMQDLRTFQAEQPRIPSPEKEPNSAPFNHDEFQRNIPANQLFTFKTSISPRSKNASFKRRKVSAKNVENEIDSISNTAPLKKVRGSYKPRKTGNKNVENELLFENDSDLGTIPLKKVRGYHKKQKTVGDVLPIDIVSTLNVPHIFQQIQSMDAQPEILTPFNPSGALRQSRKTNDILITYNKDEQLVYDETSGEFYNESSASDVIEKVDQTHFDQDLSNDLQFEEISVATLKRFREFEQELNDSRDEDEDVLMYNTLLLPRFETAHLIE